MPMYGPMAAYGQPGAAPASPFVWGRHGQRMTPDDIAMQRRFAELQMQQGSDYSPIQSPWQGLARASSGIIGGLGVRHANNEARDHAAGQQQTIEALLAGPPQEGAPDPVAAALADPELRQLGMSVLQSRTPKPVEQSDFARLIAERDALPQGSPNRTEYDRFIAGKSDPNVTVTLPGGGIFAGPQSELANVLRGGGPASPATPSPPAEAVQALLRGEGTDAQFDEMFGAGAATRARGGGVGNGTGGFPYGR